MLDQFKIGDKCIFTIKNGPREYPMSCVVIQHNRDYSRLCINPKGPRVRFRNGIERVVPFEKLRKIEMQNEEISNSLAWNNSTDKYGGDQQSNNRL